MAKFTYFATLGQYGNISDIVNENALTPVVATSTTATLLDPEGDGFTFSGTGLTYSLAGITGGTITGVNVFNSAAAPLVTVENLNLDGAAFWTAFASGGVLGALDVLTAGRDLFIGSSVGDVLYGGRGNDTIRGGGGADFIFGGKGADVLTGGAGLDTFVFSTGATDRISDFQDTGALSDDVIQLTRNLYLSMTVTETLTGVELDFGLKGSLVVDGWHAADVGRGDFLFG